MFEKIGCKKELSDAYDLFFSDSINDLPLLDVVQTPIAVNPDSKLLDHAQLKGWDVLQLHRKQ